MQENKDQNSEYGNYLRSATRTYTSAHQGVRNFSFPKNFLFVLNGRPHINLSRSYTHSSPRLSKAGWVLKGYSEPCQTSKMIVNENR